MNDILSDVPFFNTDKVFITAKSKVTNCQFYVPVKKGASEAFILEQKNKLVDELEEIDAVFVYDNPMEPLLA